MSSIDYETLIDHETLIEILEEERLYGPVIYWNEGDAPPPWDPPKNGKRDIKTYRLTMIDFVFFQLPEPDRRQTEWRKNDGPEIAAAEKGDIEPLRRKYPHFGEYINLPERKRKPGQRKTGGFHTISERAPDAAKMLPVVRALWEKTYKKKIRRHEPTTEEIVAYIYGVEVRDIKLVLSRKKSERHRAKNETVSS